MHLAITLLIKSTLLLSLTCLLLLAMRNASASLKHWMISLTLIGLLILPFCIHFLPDLEVEVPHYEETFLNKKETIPTTLSTDRQAGHTEPNPIITTTENFPIPPTFKKEATSTASQSILSYVHVGYLIVGIWCLGCLIGLWQLLLGIYKIYRITLTSEDFSLAYSNNSEVSILTNKEIQTPMTWGFKNGVILLPKEAKEWSNETLETVLLHELAHIKRKDYWVHILSLISACFYWFHPMVWWMKKQQILEREKACDEYVLREGLSNLSYAQHLIAVARNLSTASQRQINYALPMASASQLKQRITAILKFQKERFHFSKIRQWQWASFFVSLIFLLSAFTPVEKSGLVNRLLQELPVLLPNTPSLLKIDSPRTISPTTPELTFNSTIAEPPTIIDKPKKKVLQTLPTLTTSNSLIPLSKEEEPFNLLNLPKVSKESNKPAIKGQYASWTDKRSDFRFATYGKYRTISVFPFVEVEDAESMVIIEQTKRSKKKFCLVITKAPFDGKIVQSYRNGKPNSWSGNYRKGDVVYLWTVNGEWEFLGERNRDKWMSKKMSNVWKKLQHKGLLKPANEKDFFWNQLIKSQKQVKEKHFVANEILSTEDAQFKWIESPSPLINWESIPYQPTRPLKPIDKWGKIGGSRMAINTTSGSCPTRNGLKFGKVIRNMPHSILKSFNFKIHTNQHKKLEFKLHLYQMIDGAISHSIINAPIQSGIIENSYEGWVRIELSRDKIYAKGDILAVLEVDQKQGRKPFSCLMLNHALGLYSSVQKKYPIQEEHFFHQNFSFYFTVQQ